MKTSKSGFTIVELLIVIVVIGILAALVISSFSSAQLRARDARRLDDFRTIQQALELYKADTGEYPPCNGATAATTSCVVAGLSDALTPTYAKSLPNDPLDSGINRYWYARGWKMSGSNYGHGHTASSADYSMGTYLEAKGCPCSTAWGAQVNHMVGNQ